MEQKLADLTLGEKLFVWLEANKKQATWGAGIVVVLVFVVLYYFWAQKAKEVRAGEALSQVMSANLFTGAARTAPAADYLKVEEAHPGTPAGSQALILAAGALFSEGNHVEAQRQFERFNREYPGNPFASQALLGVASCLDAQGKVADAERAYKDVVVRFPNASIVSHAKLGLARSYEALAKLDDARPLYEELTRTESFSSIGNEAAFRLEAMKANQPVTATEPPAFTNAPAFQLSTPSTK